MLISTYYKKQTKRRSLCREPSPALIWFKTSKRAVYVVRRDYPLAAQRDVYATASVAAASRYGSTCLNLLSLGPSPILRATLLNLVSLISRVSLFLLFHLK